MAEKSEAKLISWIPPPMSPPTIPTGIRGREEPEVKGIREAEGEGSLVAVESSSTERMDGGTR